MARASALGETLQTAGWRGHSAQPVPKPETVGGRTNLLRVDCHGEQFLNEVILDQRNGGVIVPFSDGGCDARSDVVPLAAERRRPISKPLHSIGEKTQSAPGEEPRGHEFCRALAQKTQWLLLQTHEDGPRHFRVGRAFLVQTVRCAQVQNQFDERIGRHVLGRSGKL